MAIIPGNTGTPATFPDGFEIDDGVVTAPTLKFSDSQTGFYRPGLNQIALATAGVQRWLVDASGNVAFDTNTLYVNATNNRVGIGTASPVAPLVVEAVSFSGQIGFGRSTSATGHGFIGARDTSALEVYSGGTGASAVIGAKILDVSHAGVLSVGATTPVIIGTNGDSINRAGNLFIQTTTASDLIFRTNSVEAMRIASGGNVAFDTDTLFVDAVNNRVGIGTAIPAAKLNVVDSGGIGFEVVPNFTGSTVRLLSFNRTSSAYVPVRYDASEHFFDTSGGNKGGISSAGAWAFGPTAGGVSHDVWLGVTGSTTNRDFNLKSAGALGNSGANQLRVYDGTTNERAALSVYKHSGIASGAGFLNLRTTNGTSRHFSVDTTGNLWYSANVTDVGTATGTLIGGPSASGRYTPTLANGVNIAAVGTAYSATFSRTGNIVTVSFRIDSVDVITTGINSQLRITLPVASTINNINDLNGSATAVRLSAVIASAPARIEADTTNNQALLVWIAPTADPINITGIFQYEVK